MPAIKQATGLPAFVHASWGGLVVSAAVPEHAVEGLHQALQYSLRHPGFQKELTASGMLIAQPASLVQRKQVLHAEIEKVKPLAAQGLARHAALPR